MTKEEILSYKPHHHTFTMVRVPPNCAAGRCGHRTIRKPVIGYIKEDVLSAMDVWASLKSKEVAIGFSEWKEKNYYLKDKIYMLYADYENSKYSIEQLYTLYLDHLKQQSNG